MEQVFRAVRAAEPATRLLLCHAVRGLAGESGAGATDEQILAAVRGLCGAGEPGGDAPAQAGGTCSTSRAEPGVQAGRPRG